MNEGQLSARIKLLFSQDRFQEAEKLLGSFLEQYPDNQLGRYYLVITYYQQDKLSEAMVILEQLMAEYPEKPMYIALAARVEIAQELYERAIEKCEFLISMDPEDPEYYNIMATAKYNQRNYDKALYYADKALELDPEDLDALNLRTSAAGILGRNDAANLSIAEALQQNPNNDYTIANHAHQLLREGKVQESLDRFKEALALNPNNVVARYGLQEAMKSKFWPYKMFYKYQLAMSKLAGRQMWAVIIGAYVGINLLNRLAESNPAIAPFVRPIVITVVIIFLSTWIINPLLNLYLLRNQYGRLLLDEDDKKSAKLVGSSLLIAIAAWIGSFILPINGLEMVAIFFVAMMIPLGSMYNPPKEDDVVKTTRATLGIFILGMIGLAFMMTTGNQLVVMLAFAGIFIYQWYLNSIMIRSGARIMD